MTKDIRVACWAGIAGTLFGVLAILLTGTPGSPFPMWQWQTQDIYAYFNDANPLAVRAQYFLIGTGITLMPFFAAGLTQVLRQGTRTTVYTRMLVPCTAAVSVILLAGNALWWVAAERHFSPEATRFAVEVVAVWMLHPTAFFMALVTFCAGMAMRDCPFIPRWLAHITLTVALWCAASVFLVLATEGWLSPFHWASMAFYAAYLGWGTLTGTVLQLISLPGKNTPHPQAPAPNTPTPPGRRS
ncbi:hypothetical protein ACFH04_07890 [Streptomyces noboritoensis]|uniref:DUF998 domain-containing protein n=1 Tax=Streptomyces noboritoensis TaxID=67337 RepID=A0ABV6T8M2_9ACTN